MSARCINCGDEVASIDENEGETPMEHMERKGHNPHRYGQQ